MKEIVINNKDKGRLEDTGTLVDILTITDLFKDVIIGDFDKGLERSFKRMIRDSHQDKNIAVYVKEKIKIGNTSANSGSEDIYKVSYYGVEYQ